MQIYARFLQRYPKGTFDAAVFASETVVDAQQQVYEPQTGVAGGGQPSYEVFDPLAPELVTGTQTLTLRVHQLVLAGVPNCPPPPYVNGTWNIAFTVTPLASQTTVYHIAPVTHSGITVQPISLEVVRGQHPLPNNGYEGQGARLILRISGLTTPGAFTGAADYDTSVVFPTYGDPPKAGGGSSSVSGAHLTLNKKLPAATQIIPGSQSGDSEEVGILFWLPPPFRGSSGTLTINRIIDGFNGTNGPPLFANGPWSFTLPTP